MSQMMANMMGTGSSVGMAGNNPSMMSGMTNSMGGMQAISGMINSMTSMQSMMSGMMGQVALLDNATFNTINAPQTGVTVDKAANVIRIDSNGATIPVEGSPTWYPHPGDYWLVYGLVNPTIVIEQGIMVHFLFINMDNETHVPAITTIPPPYQYMPMMGVTTAMMNGGNTSSVEASWPAIGPMLPPAANATIAGNGSHALYSDATLTTTFGSAGTYWYLCLYPGHAQMGMYGQIIVAG